MKILAFYESERSITPLLMLSEEYAPSNKYLIYPILSTLSYTEGTFQADIDVIVDSTIWRDSTYAELVELDILSNWEQRRVLSVGVVTAVAVEAARLEYNVKVRPHTPDYGSIFGDLESLTVSDGERSYLRYSTGYPPTWLGDTVSGFPYYYPILWRTKEELIYDAETGEYAYRQPTYYLPYERLQALQQPAYLLYSEETRHLTAPTSNAVLDTLVWDSEDVPYATLELDPTALYAVSKLITDGSTSPDTVYVRFWPLSSTTLTFNYQTGDYINFDRVDDSTNYTRMFGSPAGGAGSSFNLVDESGQVAPAGSVSPTETQNTIENVKITPRIPNQQDAAFLFEMVEEYGLISSVLVRGVTSLQINNLLRTVQWFLRNKNIVIDNESLLKVSRLMAQKGRFIPHYLFREQESIQNLLNELERTFPLYFFYDKYRGIYPVYYGSATDMEVVGELDVQDDITSILLSQNREIATVRVLNVSYGYCPYRKENRYRKQYVAHEADINLGESVVTFPHIGDIVTLELAAQEMLFRLSQTRYRIQIRCYEARHREYTLSEVLRVEGTEHPGGLYRIVGKASHNQFTDYDLWSV